MSEGDLDDRRSPGPRRDCYDQAVVLLALRPHFRRQLEQKLQRRGYQASEIAGALDRLAERGYLNDGQLAREFVARSSAGKGARRVRAELARRGAPATAIAAAISGAMPADDSEAVLAAARRWCERHNPNPAALARHLERKGFSRHGILRALRELGGPTPDSGLVAPDE